MKKTTLTLLLTLSSLLAHAQIYVEGVLLTPENTGYYLEIDPLFRGQKNVAFEVDYGQSGSNRDFVTDINKNRFFFNSLVDGLNYFYANGWEVDQIAVLEDIGRKFILKRRF
jgi:hypothetical protein